MADPDLSELIEPEDEDGALTFLLTQLASFGFPTTGWQSGGRLYTALRAFARGLSNVTTAVSNIAKGGLLALSTGPWLTLLASESFQLQRFLATFAEGIVRVSVAAGAGPYTVATSQIIIDEALTGLRYVSSNSSTVTLPAGPSTTAVPFKSQSPGAAYNVLVGTGINFVTPLPGVTGAFVDLGSGTWLTQFGSDEEKDEALRIRCRSQWATIGLQRVLDAYIYLAMNTPGVGTKATKVRIDASNPRGPGTIDIWLASNAGPLPTADLALVSAYLIAMQAIYADTQVANANPLNVHVVMTVTYKGSFGTALGQAEENLSALVQSLNIGDKLYLSQVIDAVMRVPGVVNVDIPNVLLNGFNADLVVGGTEVAVFFEFAVTGVVV